MATVSAFAQHHAQSRVWFLPNQEVRVDNLPLLTAPSADASAVLATALETIIPDRDVCCGKYSGLEDAVLSARSSLKVLSVRAGYFPKSSIDPSLIVTTLMDQQPMLIKWKSHVYVLCGAIYDETRSYGQEGSLFRIHKLLLLDPRYSDQRRESEFNGETDDWNNIQGILTLSVVRP
jgi:hypothetical protein